MTLRVLQFVIQHTAHSFLSFYFCPLFGSRELRALVVEMVLATDMSCHFQQVKAMKNFLQQPEGSVAFMPPLLLTLGALGSPFIVRVSL